MVGVLGDWVTVGGILVTIAITWGMLKRDTADHARRIVKLEEDGARRRDEAVRDATTLKSAVGRIDTLEEEMKEVREDRVTRKDLQEMASWIVNQIADRRSRPR
jgi:hypothetical protein